MQVILADKAGFCFGVERAIKMATDTGAYPKPIYTLGPIIHNPQVVGRLQEQGIRPIESLAEADSGTVIIRSHGVPPDVISRAKAKGLHVVDATCPFVKRAMRWAESLYREGYKVIIVGDADHPEVIAINAATENAAQIIRRPADLDPAQCCKKVGVVSQTTQSLANYRACVAKLVGSAEEIRAYSTICTATDDRQKAAVEVARKVDIMLVVGGKNSANTTRLAQLCREVGARTYHIETAAEIEPGWFSPGQKVGITAGASTPNWLIEEVVERMNELEEKKGLQEEPQVQENQEEAPVPEADAQVEPAANGEAEKQEQPVEQNAAAEETADDTQPTVEEEAVVEEGLDNAAKEGVGGETEVSAPSMAEYDETFNTPTPGDIVTGKVVQVNEDEVLVHVGGKSEGRISRRDLGLRKDQTPEDVVAKGDEVNVYVVKVDDEGNIILSKRRADAMVAWEELKEKWEKGEYVTATVTERVKGGLLVDLGVRGFVPASHVDRNYVEDLDSYVGKELTLKIIELDEDRNNVVLSRKEVLEEEYARAKEEIFANLEEGQKVKGVVRRLTDFGAFVDIGSGVEGLLHVSEMAYSRVEHPSNVLSENDEIEVMILNVDKENERISLGLKQTLPDPWENITEKYQVGDEVEGEVTRTVDFGAFVKLEDGVEGLVHISQLADYHVAKTEDVVTPGEKVKVRVINIDPEARRIGLSMREPQKKETRKPKPKPKQQQPQPQPEKEGTGVKLGDLIGGQLEGLFADDEDES